VNTSRPRTALVVLIAMAGLSACGADDADGGADASAPTSSAGESTSGTLALTADGSTAGKCAAPNAETLASFDTAFAGTVTSLDDGTATLSVDQWYAGDEAATVTVASPSKDLQDLLMAVRFEEGKTYLVSATGGRVTLCGFTAEQSPELQALYDGAFAQ
jgi:hypothetical protein